MAFQLSLALATAYMNFSQTWFPTNIIARWMRWPGHLRYAWPLSIALYFVYAGIAMWLDGLPAAETNGWLRLAIVIASIDALKFACGVVLWPLMGAWRGFRRLTSRAER
ncbi:hypothetical protein [Cellulosimicrobium sp. CpK407]|uniref:hypothetical protein n=1 Tax=Cellulosimicrobium sp. CpK407 TaxID=3229847 RepID=UPI003F32E33D